MTRPLRVGLNGLFLLLGRMAGMETYLRALVREMPPLDPAIEYVLFVDRRNAGTFGVEAYANVREVICPVPVPANRRAAWGVRVAAEYAVLPPLVRRHGVDVLLNPAFIGPAPRGTPAVVTFHDAQHEDLPENFASVDQRVFARLLRHSARHAAHILTDSRYAKGRVETIYGIPPARVTAIHLAADARFFAPMPDAEIARVCGVYGLSTPYLLSVASLMPHKNFDTLLDAFAILRATGAGARLALVGQRSVAGDALARRIAAEGMADAVTLTGYVPDEDLPALYRGAVAFVLPSRYEGFGIPVLEAMASGTPVVTTTATSLPEVAGDAALLVDPDDTAGFVAAMRRLLTDDAMRATLIARGIVQARRFTWERAAATTLDLLRRAASPPRA